MYWLIRSSSLCIFATFFVSIIACSGSNEASNEFLDSQGTTTLSPESSDESQQKDADSGTEDSGTQSTSAPSNDSDASSSSGAPPSANEDTSEQPDNSEPDETIFDVGHPDAGSPPEKNGVDFSYIWIANSRQGTVSKIDTRTLVEHGRYITRPDGKGDPSRTSVSLVGDVAVANRLGGITRIHALPEDCHDKNRNGEIETSKNGAHLAWDEEECIAWHRPLDYNSQRAIAWTHGAYDPDLNRGRNPEVWVTGSTNGDPNIDILLLHGGSGEINREVSVPMASFAGNAERFGPAPFAYGGAVDSKNNFWIANKDSGGHLSRINYEDMSVDTWPTPYHTYGIAIDQKDRVWTCWQTLGRFDPSTESWAGVNGNFGEPSIVSDSIGGCMVDGENRLWVGALIEAALSPADSRYGVLGLDVDSMRVVSVVELPEHVRGISIDFQGYVWGVSMRNSAYRIDPNARNFQTFSNLVDAYTYSDMTGFALSLVAPHTG